MKGHSRIAEGNSGGIGRIAPAGCKTAVHHCIAVGLVVRSGHMSPWVWSNRGREYVVRAEETVCSVRRGRGRKTELHVAVVEAVGCGEQQGLTGVADTARDSRAAPRIA